MRKADFQENWLDGAELRSVKGLGGNTLESRLCHDSSSSPSAMTVMLSSLRVGFQ